MSRNPPPTRPRPRVAPGAPAPCTRASPPRRGWSKRSNFPGPPRRESGRMALHQEPGRCRLGPAARPLRRWRLHRRQHGTPRPSSALMADLEAGQVDCVVVYKGGPPEAGRLLDFGPHDAGLDDPRAWPSSVSRNQFNNTAHFDGPTGAQRAPGSFAQFEREIIVRGATRDTSVPPTRRKGKWSGGDAAVGLTTLDPPPRRSPGSSTRTKPGRGCGGRSSPCTMEHPGRCCPVVQELERRWLAQAKALADTAQGARCARWPGLHPRPALYPTASDQPWSTPARCVTRTRSMTRAKPALVDPDTFGAAGAGAAAPATAPVRRPPRPRPVRFVDSRGCYAVRALRLRP